jgi:hypothetical protein
MIDETLAKIEERIRGAGSLPEERKAELLELFTQLRGEVTHLSQTDREAARVIASHTQRSAEKATAARADRTQVQESLKSLAESVEEFEESHPRLVALVDRICVTLSGMGI